MSEEPETYTVKTPDPEPLDTLCVLKLADQANEALSMLTWIIENPAYNTDDPVKRIKAYTADLVRSVDELQTYVNKL